MSERKVPTMPKTKYSAIDPNGVTHTRSTERTYTHTVVVRRNKAAYLEAAKADWHAKQDGKNYDYYVQCAAGTHEHVTRVSPASNFHPSYSAEHIARCQEADRAENAKRIASAKAATDGLTRDEYIAKLLAERIAAAEAGDYVSYLNNGWCGRHDLAVKLAAKSAGGLYTDITILEAKAGA